MNTFGWGQMKPNEARWGQIRPDEARWRQMTPDEARWRQMRPDEARWGQMRPDEAKGGQMTPDKARWGQMTPDEARWRQMRPDEARWPLAASSGLIRFGGVDFQKNENTILQLISLCETIDLEPFWDLGWPGTLLGVSGWSLKTNLKQYWETKVTSMSEGSPHAMRRFGWICCCVVVTLSLRCCRSFPARYAVIWRHWFCLNSLTGNTRT